MAHIKNLQRESDVVVPQAGEKYVSADGTVSVVLDDVVDPSYEPSDEEVRELAEMIGMKFPEDEELLYIARNALKTPLPKEWKPCQTNGDEIYYYNFKTGEAVWDHPMDDIARRTFVKEKERVQKLRAEGKLPARSASAAAPSSSTSPPQNSATTASSSATVAAAAAAKDSSHTIFTSDGRTLQKEPGKTTPTPQSQSGSLTGLSAAQPKKEMTAINKKSNSTSSSSSSTSKPGGGGGGGGVLGGAAMQKLRAIPSPISASATAGGTGASRIAPASTSAAAKTSTTTTTTTTSSVKPANIISMKDPTRTAPAAAGKKVPPAQNHAAGRTTATTGSPTAATAAKNPNQVTALPSPSFTLASYGAGTPQSSANASPTTTTTTGAGGGLGLSSPPDTPAGSGGPPLSKAEQQMEDRIRIDVAQDTQIRRDKHEKEVNARLKALREGFNAKTKKLRDEDTERRRIWREEQRARSDRELQNARQRFHSQYADELHGMERRGEMLKLELNRLQKSETQESESEKQQREQADREAAAALKQDMDQLEMDFDSERRTRRRQMEVQFLANKKSMETASESALAKVREEMEKNGKEQLEKATRESEEKKKKLEAEKKSLEKQMALLKATGSVGAAGGASSVSRNTSALLSGGTPNKSTLSNSTSSQSSSPSVTQREQADTNPASRSSANIDAMVASIHERRDEEIAKLRAIAAKEQATVKEDKQLELEKLRYLIAQAEKAKEAQERAKKAAEAAVAVAGAAKAAAAKSCSSVEVVTQKEQELAVAKLMQAERERRKTKVEAEEKNSLAELKRMRTEKLRALTDEAVRKTMAEKKKKTEAAAAAAAAAAAVTGGVSLESPPPSAREVERVSKECGELVEKKKALYKKLEDDLCEQLAKELDEEEEKGEANRLQEAVAQEMQRYTTDVLSRRERLQKEFEIRQQRHDKQLVQIRAEAKKAATERRKNELQSRVAMEREARKNCQEEAAKKKTQEQEKKAKTLRESALAALKKEEQDERMRIAMEMSEKEEKELDAIEKGLAECRNKLKGLPAAAEAELDPALRDEASDLEKRVIARETAYQQMLLQRSATAATKAAAAAAAAKNKPKKKKVVVQKVIRKGPEPSFTTDTKAAPPLSTDKQGSRQALPTVDDGEKWIWRSHHNEHLRELEGFFQDQERILREVADQLKEHIQLALQSTEAMHTAGPFMTTIAGAAMPHPSSNHSSLLMTQGRGTPCALVDAAGIRGGAGMDPPRQRTSSASPQNPQNQSSAGNSVTININSNSPHLRPDLAGGSNNTSTNSAAGGGGGSLRLMPSHPSTGSSSPGPALPNTGDATRHFSYAEQGPHPHPHPQQPQPQPQEEEGWNREPAHLHNSQLVATPSPLRRVASTSLLSSHHGTTGTAAPGGGSSLRQPPHLRSSSSAGPLHSSNDSLHTGDALRFWNYQQGDLSRRRDALSEARREWQSDVREYLHSVGMTPLLQEAAPAEMSQGVPPAEQQQPQDGERFSAGSLAPSHTNLTNTSFPLMAKAPLGYAPPSAPGGGPHYAYPSAVSAMPSSLLPPPSASGTMLPAACQPQPSWPFAETPRAASAATAAYRYLPAPQQPGTTEAPGSPRVDLGGALLRLNHRLDVLTQQANWLLRERMRSVAAVTAHPSKRDREKAHGSRSRGTQHRTGVADGAGLLNASSGQRHQRRSYRRHERHHHHRGRSQSHGKRVYSAPGAMYAGHGGVSPYYRSAVPRPHLLQEEAQPSQRGRSTGLLHNKADWRGTTAGTSNTSQPRGSSSAQQDHHHRAHDAAQARCSISPQRYHESDEGPLGSYQHLFNSQNPSNYQASVLQQSQPHNGVEASRMSNNKDSYAYPYQLQQQQPTTSSGEGAGTPGQAPRYADPNAAAAARYHASTPYEQQLQQQSTSGLFVPLQHSSYLTADDTTGAAAQPGAGGYDTLLLERSFYSAGGGGGGGAPQPQGPVYKEGYPRIYGRGGGGEEEGHPRLSNGSASSSSSGPGVTDSRAKQKMKAKWSHLLDKLAANNHSRDDEGHQSPAGLWCASSTDSPCLVATLSLCTWRRR
eukprot:gene4673-3367_t